MRDVCRGAHDIIQQDIEVEGGGKVARDFDQAQVTSEGLGFDLSHGLLFVRSPAGWFPHCP